MAKQASKLNMIVACDMTGGIGKNGGIPWPHLKQDLGMFSAMTKGSGDNAVIMGRTTWESLPDRHKPLVGRMNVVVSSTMKQSEFPLGVHHARDIREAYDWCNDLNFKEIWIIGGAQIYKQYLEEAFLDKICLTYIEGDYECDRHFPIHELERYGYESYFGSRVHEQDGVKFYFKEYVPI
jgi:dihydrofolate reductase/thymidylate synthase